MTKLTRFGYLFVVAVVAIASTLVVNYFIMAWTEPTGIPPNGGITMEDPLPSESIMAFNLSSCPTGWRAADGTNSTPDLRGQFVRGMNDFGTGARSDGNQDPDSRSLGSLQADDANSLHIVRTGTMFGWLVADLILPDDGSWTNWTTTGRADGGNRGLRFRKKGTETRPTNVAMIYCVKD
jgi:hypothetical protein